MILRVGFQQPLSEQGGRLHCRYLLALQGKPALLSSPNSPEPPHPPPAPTSTLLSLSLASCELNVGLKNRILLKVTCFLEEKL